MPPALDRESPKIEKVLGNATRTPRLKSGANYPREQPRAGRAEIFALPIVASHASRRDLDLGVFAFWRIVVKKDAPLANPNVTVHQDLDGRSQWDR
jgi:hypothetical protein